MATVLERTVTDEELGLPSSLPTHKELPESDGTFVKNFQEHPQSIIITESLWPVLERQHPDGQFAVGQDCGIYYRLTEPRLRGAISPDWFYVPDVPPMLDGEYRRSYVLWQENILPLLILEFSSGDGSEERDRTPHSGKFWIYERAIRPAHYGIFNVKSGQLEFYQLAGNAFEPVKPNQRKHYPVPYLGIEFGIWRGVYRNVEMPWLRVWDSDGNLLPTDQERADAEAQRAELLAAKLRELGIDPNEITTP